jgi:DNA polymerase-3 subunit delta
MSPIIKAQNKSAAQLVLIHSQDGFLLHKEGQRWVDQWLDPGMTDFGLEVIDGMAIRLTDGETLLGRLMEALNTLPVLTPVKVVWWKDTNLLGEEAVATTPGVKKGLDELLDLLESGLGENFRFLVTATSLSKRLRFAKRFPKIPGASLLEVGGGKSGKGMSPAELSEHIRGRLGELGTEITPDALRLLSEWMGPNLLHMENELEKLVCLSMGAPRIEVSHVRLISSPSQENEAWDLNEAFGGRDLQKALEVLDRLLFQGESEIGLLYMMFSRVRSLLVLRMMMDEGLLRPTRDFRAFQAQLERLKQGPPIPWLAEEKRGNPLMQHPYAAYSSQLQAQRFDMAGLTNALDALVQANIELISTGGDSRIVLERALIRAIGGA